MTDLSKGIIEINGFTFHPGTKIEEVLTFFGDKVRVLECSTVTRVKFSGRRYIDENVYAYSFDFAKKTGILSSFALHPVVPDTVVDRGYGEIPRYKVTAAKQWLKGMIDDVPTSEGKESILFSYDWGYIRSATRDDRDYGLVGGEISFMIRER